MGNEQRRHAPGLLRAAVRNSRIGEEQFASHRVVGVVLLLVSADFLASDYCYDVEMKRALERRETGDVVVIPVILRPCDWTHAPFANFQALPRDGKAVTSWPNRDEAWTSVAQGIRAAL